MLKKSDFESLSCSVLLANTVTQTSIVDSKKIEVAELQKRGIVLRIPKTACAAGHIVTLYVFPKKEHVTALHGALMGNQAIPGSMAITAKVTGIEPSSDKNVIANFEFLQFIEKDWNELIGVFEVRQGEVDDLIRKIRD